MASPPEYPSHHTKVALQIEGNLNLACCGWTQDDIFHQHRLVVFRPYPVENTNTIRSSFISASGAEDARFRDFARINCIYSRRANRFFFIGTDALSAVERMLGVNLGDERRKKLRNKFDKFGPMTERSSKGDSKEDISDVFALIKNTEKLKPRNVAKGVRIYRWERLQEFLVALVGHVDLQPQDSLLTRGTAFDPLELLADNERLSSENAILRQNHAYASSSGWHVSQGMQEGSFDVLPYHTVGGPSMPAPQSPPATAYPQVYNTGFEAISFAPSYVPTTASHLEPHVVPFAYASDQAPAPAQHQQDFYWCQHGGQWGYCSCCRSH